MKIAIGAEKGGAHIAEKLSEFFSEKGLNVFLYKSVDQSDVVRRIATGVCSGEVVRGFLVGSFGMDMCSLANKHAGIRAAYVESEYAARMCRAINQSNVLCIGQSTAAEKMALVFAELFVCTEFGDGIEDWRKINLAKAKDEFASSEAGWLSGIYTETEKSDTLIIASDKSGFNLKEAVKRHLALEGQICIMDVGTRDMDKPMGFLEAGARAAASLCAGDACRAILICGTGMGMSQIANKFPGIRAVCAESVSAARISRKGWNANILCMGAWITAAELGIAITNAFLDPAGMMPISCLL